MKNYIKFVESYNKLVSKQREFTKGVDEYLEGLREKFRNGEIDKISAIIELKNQADLASDYLEELKAYREALSQSKPYRDIVMNCRDARRALKKEMYFYENDILPKPKSKLQQEKIKPIHWLKGEESLRQFLDNIKSVGLVESRKNNDIIQEHFFVDGKMPTKQTQPIKWLNDNKYLAYLMHRLAEEFIINIKGKKHELTASHFISSADKPLNTNSLASQLSNLIKHSKSTDKNISSIENIIQGVKS